MPAPRWVSLITWSKGFLYWASAGSLGSWGLGSAVSWSACVWISGEFSALGPDERGLGELFCVSLLAAMGESLSGGGGLGVGSGDSLELALLRVLLAIVSGSEDESSSVCLLTTRVFLLVRGLVRGLGWWGMHCRSCCMSSDGLGRVCFAGGVVPRIYDRPLRRLLVGRSGAGAERVRDVEPGYAEFLVSSPRTVLAQSPDCRPCTGLLLLFLLFGACLEGAFRGIASWRTTWPRGMPWGSSVLCRRTSGRVGGRRGGSALLGKLLASPWWLGSGAWWQGCWTPGGPGVFRRGPVRRSGGLLVWCGPPRWSGGPSGSEILWKCFGGGLRCALGARWVAVSNLDNPEGLQDPRSSGGVLMEGCAARLRCAPGARWVDVSHLDNPESLQVLRSSGGVLVGGCAARWEPVRVMWATWMTWRAFRLQDPLEMFLVEGCVARWEPVRVMWATWMTWRAFRFQDPLEVFLVEGCVALQGPAGLM
ncbi:hypothetical protein CBL_20863 [Carabus blaptoides fortunei]